MAVAVTAFAVVPPGGSKFKGTTNAPAFTGAKGQHFKDPVSFKVSKDKSKVTRFKFGTLGCFGSGGPPPTKNPYTFKSNTVKLKPLTLTSKGKFSGKQNATVAGFPGTVKVSGKFKKKKHKLKASGKITITQTQPGNISCGPATMKFKAKKKK